MKALVNRRRALAAVSAVGLAIGMTIAVAGAPASAGIAVQAVSGTGPLVGVTCPTASTCYAVGVSSTQSEGVVVPIIDGTPGTVDAVSETFELLGLTCPTPSTCYAVGYTSLHEGVVVPITHGVPGTVDAVSGTRLLAAVACPTPSTCYAVGESSSDGGVLVPITNGTPGRADAVSGTENVEGILEGVACPTSSTCYAVGYHYPEVNGPVRVVVPITNGSPGATVTLSGKGELAGVACPTPRTCYAVGQNTSDEAAAADAGGQVGVVVPITNGAVGSVKPVSGTQDLQGIACPTSGSCYAVGSNLSSGEVYRVVVPIGDGTPRTVAAVSGTSALVGVACATSATCYADGVNSSSEGNEGVVATTGAAPPGTKTTSPASKAVEVSKAVKAAVSSWYKNYEQPELLQIDHDANVINNDIDSMYANQPEGYSLLMQDAQTFFDDLHLDQAHPAPYLPLQLQWRIYLQLNIDAAVDFYDSGEEGFDGSTAWQLGRGRLDGAATFLTQSVDPILSQVFSATTTTVALGFDEPQSHRNVLASSRWSSRG